MKRFAFPRSHRLLRRAEYRALLRNRKTFRGQQLKIEYRRTDLPYPRLGITVSKKFGKAHRRNLWKRRLREAFRTALLPPAVDLNALPGPGKQLPSLQKIGQELATFAQLLSRGAVSNRPATEGGEKFPFCAKLSAAARPPSGKK